MYDGVSVIEQALNWVVKTLESSRTMKLESLTHLPQIE